MLHSEIERKQTVGGKQSPIVKIPIVAHWIGTDRFFDYLLVPKSHLETMRRNESAPAKRIRIRY